MRIVSYLQSSLNVRILCVSLLLVIIGLLSPAASTQSGPSYINYSAPAGLGQNAGEPSIGVNWNTGNIMFQAGLQTLRVSFDDNVSPAEATWVNKSPVTSAASLNPRLFTDPATGRTFVSQLVGKTSLSSFTDDDGATYTPSQGSGINSGVDHQTIGGGPFAPVPPGPLTPYPSAVYYASQDLLAAEAALSQTGGLTCGLAVPMYTSFQCGGLHGHIKVASDGTAYVPNKSCGSNQGVVVSTDNGTTWTVRRVPSSTVGTGDPSVGVGTHTALYFGYIAANGHPRAAISRDRGRTWTNDQDLGTPFGIQNAAFPAMVAGDDDRAALAFLGTPTGGNGTGTDKNFAGVWHLYIATSYDAGVTWTTLDATPSDPVQRGVICTLGSSCPAGTRNLLDFIDATVDRRGRVLVAYADGCTGSCVNAGPNSGTALATIARQSGGRGLFSAFDR